MMSKGACCYLCLKILMIDIINNDIRVFFGVMRAHLIFPTANRRFSRGCLDAKFFAVFVDGGVGGTVFFIVLGQEWILRTFHLVGFWILNIFSRVGCCIPPSFCGVTRINFEIMSENMKFYIAVN